MTVTELTERIDMRELAEWIALSHVEAEERQIAKLDADSKAMAQKWRKK